MNRYFSITHYGVVNHIDSVFVIGGNCDGYYTSQIAKVSVFVKTSNEICISSTLFQVIDGLMLET